MSTSEKSPYFAYSFKNRGGRDALSIHYYLHRSRLDNSRSCIDNKTPRTLHAKPKKKKEEQLLNGDISKSVKEDRSYNFESPSLAGFLNSPRSAASPSRSPSVRSKSPKSVHSSPIGGGGGGHRSHSAMSLRQRCISSMSEEIRNATPLSYQDIQEIEELSNQISHQMDKETATERRSQYDQFIINTPRERFFEDRRDLDIYNQFSAMLSKFSNEEVEDILDGVRKHVQDFKLLREYGGDSFDGGY